MKKKYLTLRIIRPSGREGQEILLAPLLDSLRDAGHSIRIDEHSFHPETPWISGSIEDRCSELIQAIEEPDTDAILCAKGGYGCSDLLPHLPWDDWKDISPKTLIGFSDITALLSAFYAKLGWVGIHGPMPATKLWTSESWDLLQNILSHSSRDTHDLELAAYNSLASSHLTQGTLIGGCLSVLSCLVGTPYFPNVTGGILFLEDINESPGQVIRNWNQLKQSHALKDIQGLIIGDFTGTHMDFLPYITQNLDIPVWITPYIGHNSQNQPIGFGAQATIQHKTLSWRIHS